MPRWGLWANPQWIACAGTCRASALPKRKSQDGRTRGGLIEHVRWDVKTEPEFVAGSVPVETAVSLPFAHLNLRRNPFGETEPFEQGELAVVDVGRHVERLRRPGYAVQFIGGRGRGKTTHLLAVRRHFPDAPYVHIGEGQRPRIPKGHPLFVDEIQRFSLRQRRRLFRRPVSLALGTHEDFRNELIDAGFEVETVTAGGSLDARRLCEIAARRIRWARRGPGRLPQVDVRTAQAMIDHYGDDLRAIHAHLYHLFQNLQGIEDV